MEPGSGEHLVQIYTSYACFGIIVNKGKVVDAPPIGRWMVGKSVSEALEWVRKKKGGYTISLPARPVGEIFAD